MASSGKIFFNWYKCFVELLHPTACCLYIFIYPPNMKRKLGMEAISATVHCFSLFRWHRSFLSVFHKELVCKDKLFTPLICCVYMCYVLSMVLHRGTLTRNCMLHLSFSFFYQAYISIYMSVVSTLYYLTWKLSHGWLLNKSCCISNLCLFFKHF